jgi:hypothetical protein
MKVAWQFIARGRIKEEVRPGGTAEASSISSRIGSRIAGDAS